MFIFERFQLGFGIGRNEIDRTRGMSGTEGWGYFCGDRLFKAHKNYNAKANEKNEVYGDSMEKGDIIGVKFEKNKENKLYNLSYFRNGNFLGIAWNDIKFEGKPLHFVVQMRSNTSVEYLVLSWSEENFKYFFEENKKNVFAFMVALNRWKKNKIVSVPKRLVYYILTNFKNIPPKKTLITKYTPFNKKNIY